MPVAAGMVGGGEWRELVGSGVVARGVDTNRRRTGSRACCASAGWATIGRPMARWKALSKGFPMVPGAVFLGGSRAGCASVEWVTNGSLRAFQWCQGRILWVVISRSAIGSRAGCASVGWATNGSLESPFQGLSNGAWGGFRGWLLLGLRSVEFGFGLTTATGLTSAVGLCLNVL
eukprot:scaffold20962_cov112-Isochrysis_galbana.AAC.7